jgi:hypothetical protein
MIAMSLAIVWFLALVQVLLSRILPWIDSARRHDRHEHGDRQGLGLSSGLVIGFYLGSTVPGGMIAMSLAISRFSA